MAFDNPAGAVPSTASDPYATFVNASCFELLLVELVPMAYRLEAAKAFADEEWSSGNTVANGASNGVDTEEEGRKEKKIMGGLGVGGIGGTAPGMDEDELRESVFWRLDELGYRVGQGLAERFSRDKPRFTDPLDAIKFLCKDLWTIAFRKQIDNLKTNHRGTFVLTDNAFRPLTRISLERGREPAKLMAQAQPFLYFPCGLLRGALSAMGITASVQAETSELPTATFQIRTTAVK